MCKSMKELMNADGGLDAKEWRETVEKALATAYMLTQMIQIQSPELVAMKEGLMMLFASAEDDGGTDGVLAAVGKYCDAVEAATQQRNADLAEALARKAL